MKRYGIEVTIVMPNGDAVLIPDAVASAWGCVDAGRDVLGKWRYGRWISSWSTACARPTASTASPTRW